MLQHHIGKQRLPFHQKAEVRRSTQVLEAMANIPIFNEHRFVLSGTCGCHAHQPHEGGPVAQAEQLSRTVQKIYAAAADASLWPSALGSVEELTRSAGAVVHIIPKGGSAPKILLGLGAEDLFPAPELAEWERDYMANCPRLAAGAKWPDRPSIFDRMIFGEAEMDRDPSYHWWDQHGVRYFIGSLLPETDHHMLAWSLQRTRRQGHVEHENIALFELIRPHLAQAMAIADSLDTLAAHQRFSDAMLNVLPQAIFGLDELGLVLFANAAADRLLSVGDCLRTAHGRLVTAATAQQAELDRLIANALSRGAGGVTRIDRRDSRQPCMLRVSPIVVDEAERFLRPAVLVIVSDPASVTTIDGDTLRTLYHLTPAEARTAAALLAGHSIQSAAQLVQVSGETVRSHLKAVFRKVGVSRQQDLVRVLAELEMSSVPPAISPE